MKIAILTPFFFPSLGGTERAIEMLAREFSALGHEVRILTLARGPDDARGDVPEEVLVVRRPSPAEIIRHMRWADVGLLNYLSLQLGLPALLSGTPYIVAHHHFPPRVKNARDAALHVLRALIAWRRPALACSQMLADLIGPNTHVAPNGYRDDVWRPSDALSQERPIDVLFVGRVVPEKGVTTFLKAIARLHGRWRPLKAVMIGPEGDGLSAETLAQEHGVKGVVEYWGALPSAMVAEAQGQAKVMAIPSRREPFGIVALEGMAMGAAIVAANSGGLPEAVGSAGLLVDPDDADAWAESIESLLESPEQRAELAAAASAHLVRFTARAMAQSYLTLLEAAAGGATR